MQQQQQQLIKQLLHEDRGAELLCDASLRRKVCTAVEVGEAADDTRLVAALLEHSNLRALCTALLLERQSDEGSPQFSKRDATSELRFAWDLSDDLLVCGCHSAAAESHMSVAESNEVNELIKTKCFDQFACGAGTAAAFGGTTRLSTRPSRSWRAGGIGLEASRR